MSKPPSPIVDQQDALSLYMNDMLTSSLEVLISDEPAIQHTLDQPNKVVITQDASKDWRQSPFQALLFEVQGLKLALPLHQLNGIFSYPETKLPKLPGKPAWYLGLYQHQEYRAQVVDTAHIIMPGGFNHAHIPPKYIILIDNHNWGLSCNTILEVITLSPDDVKWRKQLGSRSWLAGTALKQMCSILNVTMLSKQLAQTP
ncbi:MAG: chemotaxis protein CheW [Gammaproteobacteria bacterium]|nr:chemotaxis protein CheW [Gammaproteobacteria bacterium]